MEGAQALQGRSPLTKQLVLAFAWHLLTSGRGSSATTLLLTYYACLRVSEALRLRWSEVALPGDPRLHAFDEDLAGLNIIDSKTARYSGKTQFVPLTDSNAITYLTALNNKPHNFQARVTDVSFQVYTNHLKETAVHFGFAGDIFTSHSARIGKATEDFISGVSVQQIALQGRWECLNSLRYYINNGKARLLNNHISPSHQTDIQGSAQLFRRLIAQHNKEQHR